MLPNNIKHIIIQHSVYIIKDTRFSMLCSKITIATQKQNNETYDQQMADYNAKMAALEKDQHKIATYTQYWNYGADQHFAVLQWTADLTWHWDSTKQQVVVTNVKITYTRGNPNYKGGGFWDAYVLMNPNMSVPEEGGAFTEPAPDLPGIDGNKLWQTIGTSQSGIFAFFTQNNKTYEYSIDYNLNSTVPYNAVNLGNGKYELLKSVMRQNTGTRPTKSVVWRETGVNVDIDLPVKPTLKTAEAHYHYVGAVSYPIA